MAKESRDLGKPARERKPVNYTKTIELFVEEENVHEDNNKIVLDGDLTVRPSLCRVTTGSHITFRSAHPFIVRFYDPNSPTAQLPLNSPFSPFKPAIINTTGINQGQGPYEHKEVVIARNEKPVYYKYAITVFHKYLFPLNGVEFIDDHSATIIVGDWP